MIPLSVVVKTSVEADKLTDEYLKSVFLFNISAISRIAIRHRRKQNSSIASRIPLRNLLSSVFPM